MSNCSITWVSLHKQLSHAKKNLSAAEREIYIVVRFNFHLLTAMQLGQSLTTWILCKLACEEV